VNLSTYLEVLRVKQVRNALLLGLLIRVPMWAGAVLVTVHVVSHLERTYAQAGLIGGAASIAVAISGPWRGSKLDKLGLRRAVWPSLVVNAIVWSIAPWVGYWLLMAMVIVGGLFVIPTYSILRQVVISQVPPTTTIATPASISMPERASPATTIIPAATTRRTGRGLLAAAQIASPAQAASG